MQPLSAEMHAREAGWRWRPLILAVLLLFWILEAVFVVTLVGIATQTVRVDAETLATVEGYAVVWTVMTVLLTLAAASYRRTQVSLRTQ